MPTAPQLAEGNPALAAAVQRSRTPLNRRALVAAVAGTAGARIDWAVDAALLSRLVPAINAQFGLTPAQLDKLTRASATRSRRPPKWWAPC